MIASEDHLRELAAGWTLIHVPDELTTEIVVDLLEERGIRVQVLELTRSGGTDVNARVGVELYVPDEHAEDAGACIAEVARTQTTGGFPRLEAGEVCPVHGKPPDVPCSRCGGFVCGECVAGDSAPECDACEEKALAPARKSRAGIWLAGAVLLLFAGLLLDRIVRSLLR